ncbi:hypothetical protein GCM10009564_13330 [Streptomyces thermogriseus]|uniref:Uncharacterized protein n=1 Tax=Streptomyces thermogriseus TaxID=75292 RepID=A0ABN1SWD0_9ACTN
MGLSSGGTVGGPSRVPPKIGKSPVLPRCQPTSRACGKHAGRVHSGDSRGSGAVFPGRGGRRARPWRGADPAVAAGPRCEARGSVPGLPGRRAGRTPPEGRNPGGRDYGRPVVTVRSGENAPQVPSGSIARIRTRWVTPASRPM